MEFVEHVDVRSHGNVVDPFDLNTGPFGILLVPVCGERLKRALYVVNRRIFVRLRVLIINKRDDVRVVDNHDAFESVFGPQIDHDVLGVKVAVESAECAVKALQGAAKLREKRRGVKMGRF